VDFLLVNFEIKGHLHLLLVVDGVLFVSFAYFNFVELLPHNLEVSLNGLEGSSDVFSAQVLVLSQLLVPFHKLLVELSSQSLELIVEALNFLDFSLLQVLHFNPCLGQVLILPSELLLDVFLDSSKVAERVLPHFGRQALHSFVVNLGMELLS